MAHASGSEFLGWPVALLSFRQNAFYTDTSPLSPSLYIENLYGQRKSMEELLVLATMAGDPQGDGLSTGSQLREFTSRRPEKVSHRGKLREFL